MDVDDLDIKPQANGQAEHAGVKADQTDKRHTE